MRISDDRYSRDRQRLDLALRFIHHEARTRTIRVWTGLTDDRIRKLYRSYVAADGVSGMPQFVATIKPPRRCSLIGALIAVRPDMRPPTPNL